MLPKRFIDFTNTLISYRGCLMWCHSKTIQKTLRSTSASAGVFSSFFFKVYCPIHSAPIRHARRMCVPSWNETGWLLWTKTKTIFLSFIERKSCECWVFHLEPWNVWQVKKDKTCIYVTSWNLVTHMLFLLFHWNQFPGH